MITKALVLAIGLGLSLPLTAAANTCIGYYGVEAKINYQQTLAALMMSMSPEMQMEVGKQLQISQQFDLSQVPTTHLEASFFGYIAKAQAEGRFDVVFEDLMQKLETVPQIKGKLSALPPEKKAEVTAMIKGGLLGEIQLRQFHGKKIDSDIWGTIAKNVDLKMDNFTNWLQLNSNQKLQKIADLTGTQVVGASNIQYLIDGPMAFAKRDEVVSRAQKSIHILTWSVYDDVTGTRFADQMIKRHSEGIDIKIIVDALTAQKPGHNQQLGRMIQAGIPIIFSRNPNLFLSGQHRKAMVIDGSEVIAGGMNYGDVYSHMGDKAKWRDTDVYFTGSLAGKTQNLFATEWNEQVKFQKLPLNQMEKVVAQYKKGETKALMLNSSPADFKTSGSPILRALLALIKGSKKEIIIENAYVITNPTIELALQKAIARGVKVTIITNSNKSVDEPVVSDPILASTLRLKKIGANIVLKAGDTLHSKVALFDGEVSVVTSYNLHPRSELLEDEMAYIFVGAPEANGLRVALQNDIKNNIQVKDDSEITLASEELMMFINRLFYNQL